MLTLITKSDQLNVDRLFHLESFTQICGTNATHSYESYISYCLLHKFHSKMIVQVQAEVSLEKKIFSRHWDLNTRPSNLPGGLFLTGICISPIDHFAPIVSQCSGPLRTVM